MRDSATWPPAGTSERTLYATPDGELSLEAPLAETSVSWRHDPADLVPSSAANAFAFLLERPDEAPIGARADVISYSSAALTRDLDLVGPVRAEARLCSDGPVMDLFVRLLDVAPDGSALRIARGQVQLLDATSTSAVVVDLGQLGYRIRAGHRLRVHLSSSDYPEFIPQPGTGEEPWSAAQMRPNTQSLALGGADPFRITLSVLEGEPA